MKKPDALIKSRARVKERGEVFTPAWMVEEMLDLVTESAASITARFLEPACGNGNFLAGILARKLATVHALDHANQSGFEFSTLLALTSIYAIDIAADNVAESRARLRTIIEIHATTSPHPAPTPGFLEAVDFVLERNLIVGDFLNSASIRFTEFTESAKHELFQRVFRLDDISGGQASPIIEIESTKYWMLAGTCATEKEGV